MTRIAASFGALVLAQSAHSVEEYAGRLWESFPPAPFVSGLVSTDLERGFVIANILLVTFIIELVNGIGHPLWTLRQGGYTPGVGTAPFCLSWPCTWRPNCGRRLITWQAPRNVLRRGWISISPSFRAYVLEQLGRGLRGVLRLDRG